MTDAQGENAFAMSLLPLGTLYRRILCTLLLCVIGGLTVVACQRPALDERSVVDPDSPLLRASMKLDDLPWGYHLEQSLLRQVPVTPTLQNNQTTEWIWHDLTVTSSFDNRTLILTHQLSRYEQQAPVTATLHTTLGSFGDPITYTPALSLTGQVLAAECAREKHEKDDLIVCEAAVNYSQILSKLRITGTAEHDSQSVEEIFNQVLMAIEKRISQ